MVNTHSIGITVVAATTLKAALAITPVPVVGDAIWSKSGVRAGARWGVQSEIDNRGESQIARTPIK